MKQADPWLRDTSAFRRQLHEAVVIARDWYTAEQPGGILQMPGPHPHHQGDKGGVREGQRDQETQD